MTNKNLRTILKEKKIPLKRAFNRENVRDFFIICGASLALSALLLGGPSWNKWKEKQRKNYQERMEFAKKVEEVMKDPSNMVGYSGTETYWDLDGDNKPDAVHYFVPGFKVYDSAIRKIK